MRPKNPPFIVLTNQSLVYCHKLFNERLGGIKIDVFKREILCKKNEIHKFSQKVVQCHFKFFLFQSKTKLNSLGTSIFWKNIKLMKKNFSLFNLTFFQKQNKTNFSIFFMQNLFIIFFPLSKKLRKKSFHKNCWRDFILFLLN